MAKTIEPYKGIAETYEAVRPSYPEMLINDVISKTNITPGSNLLEIGAGTGKATVQFADKGYSIDAIEIGEDMAEILKSKCTNYPNVTVEVKSFEDWIPGKKNYDMIYCAQAFHWLDLNTKYKKCYDLLKNKGFLVLFWYSPCVDELYTEINEKSDSIIKKYSVHQDDKIDKKDSSQRRVSSGIWDNDVREKEIKDSGLFKIIERLEYTLELKETFEQSLKSKFSIPEFATILDGLDDTIINKMYQELNDLAAQYGGYMCTKFHYTLFITQKIQQDTE